MRAAVLLVLIIADILSSSPRRAVTLAILQVSYVTERIIQHISRYYRITDTISILITERARELSSCHVIRISGRE